MKLVRPQTVHKIATTAFRSHLSSSNPQPLVLTGLIDHWPALSNWKVSNKLGRLRDKQWEDRIIEVEWGKKRGSYMDEGYRRVHMPLGLFLDAFILKTIPSSGEIETAAYLAQQDLFSVVPELKPDAPPLALIHEGLKGEFWRCNAWIGRETFTPIHRDPYSNLFCQVIGTKSIHLFPPRQHSHLSIPTHGAQSQTSLIPYSPHPSSLFTKFPLLERAYADEQSKQVELGEGEVLFIPEGWYHTISSLGEEVAASVNYWFR